MGKSPRARLRLDPNANGPGNEYDDAPSAEEVKFLVENADGPVPEDLLRLYRRIVEAERELYGPDVDAHSES